MGQHLPRAPTPALCPCPSTGPSIALDTACSSSLLALQNAYQAIRSGECPAALVGGINLLLKPNTSVQFMKLGMLSPDGTCRSFDDSGKVWVRVIRLQPVPLSVASWLLMVCVYVDLQHKHPISQEHLAEVSI